MRYKIALSTEEYKLLIKEQDTLTEKTMACTWTEGEPTVSEEQITAIWCRFVPYLEDPANEDLKRRFEIINKQIREVV